MIDSHIQLANWGIKPVIYQNAHILITSYSFFISLAILIGLVLYFYNANKYKQISEHSLIIAMSSLVGGAIGAKLIIIIQYANQVEDFSQFLLSGRSIVGGLIGGWFSVWIVKKLLKVTDRRGDVLAPSLALGLAIGRIGCFLAGCCFGVATNMGFGIDFGDGILRWPTQLFEAILGIVLFIYLQFYLLKHKSYNGQAITQFITIYFIFRFFLEFIKVEQDIFLGLTIYQWLSVLVLLKMHYNQIINLIKSIKWRIK